MSNNTTIAGNIAVNGIAGQSRSTTINHIDSYTLEETGVISVDLSRIISAINDGNSETSGSSLSVSSNISNSNSPNSVASKDIAKGNTSNLTASTETSTTSSTDNNINKSDLSGASPETIFSGTFKINLDPAATTPLVEARSQFTDASKFFGSEYYFNQLGLNGAAVLADIDQQTRTTTSTRILGDSFVETKLILDQIRTLTNDSLLLSKNTTDSNAQIKELLDNSIAEFARLGLSAQEVAMNGLTKDQTNLLSKDIITFETTKVNGVNVLAPKIYLSLATRSRLLNTDSTTNSTALANGGTIFAKDSLTLDSSLANLMNSGSIRSDGNLNLNLASLTNKTNSLSQAQIISSNNLGITANNGDIKNIGANIGSVGALSLTAVNGNILNTTIVQTNDADLLASNSDSYQLGFNDTARSSGNITSTLLQNASIKGGSIAINTGGDFTNLAANISTAKNTLADESISSGALTITAGDDINIGTLSLRNRTEERWGSKKKGGERITDTTANLQSKINSEGNLNLASQNNTIIQAADINSKENINIDAGNNLLLLTATDSNFFSESTRHKGTLTFKNNDRGSIDTSIINNQISSESGNINLNANNIAYVQYKSGTEKNLDYLNQITSSSTLQNPIDEIHKNWDQTTRGLTSTGQVLVAVVAVAAVAVTAGAAIGAAGAAAGTATATAAGATTASTFATAASVGSATLTAAAGATAATASVSATNASMNDSGNFFGSLDNVTKVTLKETTSKESLKNIAISAAAAGITAGVGSATGLTSTTSTTNTTTFTTKLENALATQTLNSTTSAAVQSAVNGDSFGDAIQNQGKNIIINTLGQVAANQIGDLAHPDPNSNPNALTNPIDGTTTPAINTTTQLALHAGLGCAMGAASNGNCGAGAAGAVVGEVVGSSLKSSVENGTMTKDTAVQIAGLAGAAAGLTASIATGQDDAETANGVWAGSREGANAARNNAMEDVLKPTDPEYQTVEQGKQQATQIIKDTKTALQNNLADSYVSTDSTIAKAGIFTALVGTNMFFPESFTEVQLGQCYHLWLLVVRPLPH